jgi:hypothetical protein
MNTINRRGQKERRHPDGITCRILLTYEKERSERLNRFFSFCGLIVKGTQGADLIGFLKNEMRTSDYVFEIPNTDGSNTDESGQAILKIGLLLPETDLPEAAIVKDRINKLCSARKLQFQIVMVTYPDDATLPGDILEKAFKNVLPRGIDETRHEVESC